MLIRDITAQLVDAQDREHTLARLSSATRHEPASVAVSARDIAEYQGAIQRRRRFLGVLLTTFVAANDAVVAEPAPA